VYAPPAQGLNLYFHFEKKYIFQGNFDQKKKEKFRILINFLK